MGTIIHLRMQLGARLVGQHMERIALFGGPHPFDRLHPAWMARAIIIAKIGYGLGKQFNPATGCGQRRAHRISKKFRQENPVIIQCR